MNPVSALPPAAVVFPFKEVTVREVLEGAFGAESLSDIAEQVGTHFVISADQKRAQICRVSGSDESGYKILVFAGAFEGKFDSERCPVIEVEVTGSVTLRVLSQDKLVVEAHDFLVTTADWRDQPAAVFIFLESVHFVGRYFNATCFDEMVGEIVSDPLVMERRPI